jgi:uncharacterized membrane protein
MENYPNEAHTPYGGYSGRYYKLPIIGDYAEKWANSWRD